MNDKTDRELGGVVSTPEEEIAAPKNYDRHRAEAMQIAEVWEHWLQGHNCNASRTTRQIGEEILRVREWVEKEKFAPDIVGWAVSKLATLVWCGHFSMTLHMAHIVACRIARNQLDEAIARGLISEAEKAKAMGFTGPWFKGRNRAADNSEQEDWEGLTSE